jgi:hypothetical protein
MVTHHVHVVMNKGDAITECPGATRDEWTEFVKKSTRINTLLKDNLPRWTAAKKAKNTT